MLVFLLWTNTSYAEIKLSDEVAAGVCVRLKQCELLKEKLTLMEERMSKLEEQGMIQDNLYTGAMKMYKDANKTVDALNELIGEQKSMYEEAIEQSKPSIFHEIGKAVAFIAVGFGLCLLL